MSAQPVPMSIWLDGKLVPKEQATVSVFDHGLLYGDGVFEGIRIYNRRIFRLDQHLDRLYDSAKAIALDIGLDRAALVDALRETIKANRKEDGYIRLIVTRGVKVITSASRQVSHEAFDARVKSLNYLKNVLAKIDANRAGAHEAILLNAEGFVGECTADNLFVVKHGTILTPSPQDGALEGITRGALLELAGEARIPAREKRLTRYDVYTADECFLSGTGAEVMPIAEVDGRKIGTATPGPVTKRLLDAFHALVRREGDPIW